MLTVTCKRLYSETVSCDSRQLFTSSCSYPILSATVHIVKSGDHGFFREDLGISITSADVLIEVRDVLHVDNRKTDLLFLPRFLLLPVQQRNESVDFQWQCAGGGIHSVVELRGV